MVLRIPFPCYAFYLTTFLFYLSQPSSSKRKLDDLEPEGTEKLVRRILQKPASHDSGQMTTVICLHAAVAQKSYGSEKRFLCPPPLVRIEGSFTNFREQQLSMSIVAENGERSPEQKAPLDANMMASFKYLHVTGTAKAKSFQLSLQVAQPQTPTLTSDGADQRASRTWATFESAPVTIISKPSKKTAKTRNMSSCILAGGPVSLFNRINSQTVRTKYMTIDRTQLCASNTSWSAFNVNVLNRPVDSNAMGKSISKESCIFITFLCYLMSVFLKYFLRFYASLYRHFISSSFNRPSTGDIWM